jgi:hypothetical protein
VRRLRPFFSYFGAKSRLAPQYPKPRYQRVVEPFAGSAGYSLLHFRRDVVLVDLDPLIASLWKWLIVADPKEILALPLLEPEQKVAELGVHPDASALIGFWCNKGATRPCQQITTTWGEKYSEQFWGEGMRSRVARQVSSIRHWTIIEGEYHASPTDAPATFHVDPPYIGRSRISKYRGGGQDRDQARRRSLPQEHEGHRLRRARRLVPASSGSGDGLRERRCNMASVPPVRPREEQQRPPRERGGDLVQ